MFAEAYSQATAFTRPVIMSRRRVDGSCDAGIGSFVIINDEGWIVTAEHIVREYQTLRESNARVQQHLATKRAIENDAGLLTSQKRKRMRELGPLDPKAVSDYSFWWGADGVTLKDALVLGPGVGDPILSGDIAIGRLDPFDPNSVSHYPQFKDPTKSI